MSILMAGLSLLFLSDYEIIPTFERLEEAGYTKEVSSLLEALVDEDRLICQDAAEYLKGRVKDTDCPDIMAAVLAAVDRDCLICVFSVTRLLVSDCDIKVPPDEVVSYARAIYYSNRIMVTRSLAFRVLHIFHRELGFDIFEDARHCALTFPYITNRYDALEVLLKSYCERLQSQDFEVIHKSLMEGDPRREDIEPWRKELADKTEASVRARVETLLQKHPYPCPEEREDN